MQGTLQCLCTGYTVPSHHNERSPSPTGDDVKKLEIKSDENIPNSFLTGENANSSGNSCFDPDIPTAEDIRNKQDGIRKKASDDESNHSRQAKQNHSKNHGNISIFGRLWIIIHKVEFKYVKLVQLLCGLYILGVTFTEYGILGCFGGAVDPESGYVIDMMNPDNTSKGLIEYTNYGHTFTRAIVAETTAQMVFLSLSRFSAFFMYPAIVLIFWSKLRATQTFISKTGFGVFCIGDTHRLHVYCGWVIFSDSCLHTTFHMARWIMQGNIGLLFQHRSGLTGLIVIISTFIIVVPMTFLSTYWRYEIRKSAHYLFWIFVGTMAFHAPLFAIPNGGFCAIIFPVLFFVYAIDACYVKCFMTEKITTVKYEALKSGVQLSMPVSKRFQNVLKGGGYAYIMFDWINKNQWHAFSIYENPQNKQERHIFISAVGDWTRTVHDKMDRNTVRPVWISGPFLSPYNNAGNYDNMILVAAGIGITPALSAIESYKDSRRVNLIWAVRDASMLSFFLEHAMLDHKGFNLIFYTGKDPLPTRITNHLVSATLKIIHARPKLEHLLPNTIHYIEKGIDLPENSLGIRRNNHGLALRLKEQVSRLKCDGRMSNEQKFNQISEFVDVELDSSLRTSNDATELSERRKLEINEIFQNVDIEATVENTSNQSNGLGQSKQTDVPARESIEGFIVNSAETRPQSCLRSVWETSQTGKSFKTPRLWENESGAREYVLSMNPSYLATWGFLYCGSRNGLLDNLQKESSDLGIPLHVEALDW